MLNKREKYLYIFIFWVIFTFILTSIPKLPGVSGISHFDKIAHFLIYGVSGLLYSCYLREGNLPKEMIFIYTVLLISLIGGIDEVHQRWVPFRVSSFSDLMADILGGICGSVVVIVADRLKFFRPTTNNE
jgi:VanZ family protein